MACKKSARFKPERRRYESWAYGRSLSCWFSWMSGVRRYSSAFQVFWVGLKVRKPDDILRFCNREVETFHNLVCQHLLTSQGYFFFCSCFRISFNSFLFFNLSFCVHISIQICYYDCEEEWEEWIDILKQDIVIHSIEVILIVIINQCHDLFNIFALHKHKPSDVNCQTEANNVIHFKKETKSSFFHLVDSWKKFDHFIHNVHAKVDEHQPVNILHMVDNVLQLFISLSKFDEAFRLQLEREGD